MNTVVFKGDFITVHGHPVYIGDKEGESPGKRHARLSLNAEGYAETGAKEFHKGLSSKEVAIVSAYTSHGDKVINGHLRGLDYEHADSKESEQYRESIPELKRIVEKAVTPDEIVVYRGVKGDFLAKLKPGQVFSDRGFLSTSADPDIAHEFAEGGKKSAFIQYEVPKGFEGAAPVATMSHFRHEREILIKPEVRWEAVSVTRPQPFGPLHIVARPAKEKASNSTVTASFAKGKGVSKSQDRSERFCYTSADQIIIEDDEPDEPSKPSSRVVGSGKTNMSKWTKADRDALPEADFGEPASKLFPIKDQDDVDSAARLIGKAKNPDAVKKRIIGIAKRKGLKLPDAWNSADHSSDHSADFATVLDDGMVLREGKLWEAGEYPDKDYGMTPEENWAAVQQFKPVDLGIEHCPTILDGKLGQLRDMRLTDDGQVIEGTLAIPGWLNDVIGDEPLKVSCEWDRETKTISKLGLVVSPRVTDAAVMSAYADFAKRHDTPEGQSAIQQIHDMAGRAGAKCQPAQMHSGHEVSGLQKIHDMSVDHGATCSSTRNPKPYYFSRAGKSGAGQENKMSLAKKFVAFMRGEGYQVPEEDLEGAETPAAPAASSTPAAPSAEFTAAQKQIEELTAKMSAIAAEKRRGEAETFAAAVIASGKATPAESKGIVADYVQAATDDEAHPATVNFDLGGEAKTGSRVDALKARFANRPAHVLFGQALPASEGTQAIYSRAITPDPSADRKLDLNDAADKAEYERLLNMTPAGQAVFAKGAGK